MLKLIVRLLAVAGIVSLFGGGAGAFGVLTGETACKLTGQPALVPPGSGETPERAVVVNFYKEVLLDHQLDKAGTYLRPDYIQHNPRVGQGLDGFVAYFTKLNSTLKGQGARSEGEVTMEMTEGNLVTLHVTTVINGPISASFRSIDTFRVQDGMIAEHWDVIQPCDLRSSILMAISG